MRARYAHREIRILELERLLTIVHLIQGLIRNEDIPVLVLFLASSELGSF